MEVTRVATATAIGLFVDVARLPVCVVTQRREIIDVWPLLIATTIGVALGTAVSARVLKSIAQPVSGT